MHVNDRREAESTPILLVCVDTGPACHSLLEGERENVGVHTWSRDSIRVSRSGQELSCMVKMEEACMFVCV